MKKAFTLIELVVCVAIIGIVAGLMVSFYKGLRYEQYISTEEEREMTQRFSCFRVLHGASVPNVAILIDRKTKCEYLVNYDGGFIKLETPMMNGLER